MNRRAIFPNILIPFILFIFFFSIGICVLAYADNRDTTVYITDSGSKYHLGSCSYLRSSKREVTLEYAARNGYTACSRCHPPIPDFSVTSTPIPTSKSSESTRSTSQVRHSPSSSTSPAQETHYNPATDPSVYTPVSSTKTSLDLPYELLMAIFVGTAVIIFWGDVFSSKKEKYSNQSKSNTQPSYSYSAIQQSKVAITQNRSCSPTPQTDLPQKTEDVGTDNILYSKEEALQLSGCPDGCYIAADGFPACKYGDEKWGEGYTFYVAYNKEVFHSGKCSLVKRYSLCPVNAVKIRDGIREFFEIKPYHPCYLCKPILPELMWYDKYEKLLKTPKPPVKESIQDTDHYVRICYRDNSQSFDR